jgi:anti-anti-sigma factor
MDIEVKPKGTATIVRLRGRIVDGKPANALQDALRKLLRAQHVRTIFDVADVTYVDSLAIGIFVSHYISVSQLGGGIVLLNANARLAELMKITHLTDRFGWATHLDDAIKWFDAKR